ncbi:hypothetical protein LTR12_016984 [Friedmanniomyces endolithicus]|nr:hypothetical protein LTR12_016984 [Friedmanniomyces endolithicus]
MPNQDSGSAASAASPDDDDWSSVTDPNERRKIQNRIAQRKFRKCLQHDIEIDADDIAGDKMRLQKEVSERDAENARKASGAYRTPEPEDLDRQEPSGLPWGGISLRHVIATGKAKEQSSRETSLYAAASKTGGSSRLGLHLIDQYARGSPAWTYWRHGSVPSAQAQQLQHLNTNELLISHP